MQIRPAVFLVLYWSGPTMVRVLKSFASASFANTLSAAAPWVVLSGLVFAGAGCSSDAPTPAPAGPATPESEKGVVQKVEEKAVDLGHKAVDATGSAVKATGGAIESAGQKLETSAAQAVKENVGQKAGELVEGTGKALEKAGEAVDKGGDKLKSSAAPK